MHRARMHSHQQKHDITKAKTFKKWREIYKFNSSFKWSHWTKIDNLLWAVSLD